MKTHLHTTFNKHGEPLIVKKYYIQFASIQLIVGAISAAFIFNPTYLKQIGLSATGVGLFMSMISFVGVFSPFIWGLLSDRYKTVKKLIIIGLAAILVFYLPVPLYNNVKLGSLTLAPIMIVISSAFYNVPGTMTTTWLMEVQKKHHDLQYGLIRMFFVGAYSLTNLGFMFLIKMTSINLVFICCGLFSVLCILRVSRYPDIEGNESNKSLKDMGISRIFKNPLLLAYIAFMSIACIPASSFGIFTPYLIENLNGNPSILGGMIALRSLSSLPFLYLSGRFIRKIGPINSLKISISIVLITQILFYLSSSITQVFFIFILSGVALGLTMPSEITFINENAPPELLATTQIVCGSVYSIAGIISSFFGGMAVDNFGIRNYYLIVTVLISLALIFFFISTPIIKKRMEADQLHEKN